MTLTGRRVRLGATAIVLVLLVTGSLWGSDDSFPFGPFRMYATSGSPNGVVTVPELVGVVGSERFKITPETVNIRRAEIEGQFNRFREPKLLRSLLATYEERTGRELDELQLVVRRRRIVDGRRVGPSRGRVVARYEVDR